MRRNETAPASCHAHLAPLTPGAALLSAALSLGLPAAAAAQLRRRGGSCRTAAPPPPPLEKMTELDAWAAVPLDDPRHQHRQHAGQHHHLGDRLGESAHHQGVRRGPGEARVQDRALAGGLEHLRRRGRHHARQDEPRRARSSTGSPRAGMFCVARHPLGRRLDRLRREGEVSRAPTPSAPRRRRSSGRTGSRSRRSSRARTRS